MIFPSNFLAPFSSIRVVAHTKQHCSRVRHGEKEAELSLSSLLLGDVFVCPWQKIASSHRDLSRALPGKVPTLEVGGLRVFVLVSLCVRLFCHWVSVWCLFRFGAIYTQKKVAQKDEKEKDWKNTTKFSLSTHSYWCTREALTKKSFVQRTTWPLPEWEHILWFHC